MLNEWNGFNDGVWTKEINVRNFIQKNYTLYEGDDSFLACLLYTSDATDD